MGGDSELVNERHTEGGQMKVTGEIERTREREGGRGEEEAVSE